MSAFTHGFDLYMLGTICWPDLQLQAQQRRALASQIDGTRRGEDIWIGRTVLLVRVAPRTVVAAARAACGATAPL